MVSLASLASGHGYLWVEVCLLFLFPPPSFPALVFPNDVLASLDKFKGNVNNDHKPKTRVMSPVIPSSPSSSPGAVSTGTAALPVDPTLTRHSYPSVPGGAPVPSNDPLQGLYSPHKLNRDLFPASHSMYEDDVQDYDDYSDYPDLQFLSHPRDTAPKAAAKEAVVLSSRHVSPSSPSDVDNLQEKTSTVHQPESQVKEAAVSEAVDRPEGQVKEEQVRHDGQSSQDKKEERKECPRCKIRDEDRAYRIESLKRKILNSLHFTTPPNRTGMAVPKALAHMSGIHSDLLQDAPYGGVQHQYYDDEDDEYTPPERVFTAAKPVPSHLNKGDKHSCYFTMPAEVFRSRVTKAFLWFYVRHASHPQSNVIQMKVDRLGPPFSKKQRSSKRIVWSQKAYAEKAFGWKKVELTNIVRRWVNHPSSNYGVDILAMNGHDNLAVLPPTSTEFEGYEPMLDIKVTKDGKRRYRRSDSLTCSENATEHRCCRYPLTVSFAEFGWEWVIAPTHVKADYCSGECRMTLQNKTPYSWIASQTLEGGSCCTPSKMTALPLLYFDQRGDVVFQMLQNMKVERCGCA